MSQNKPNAVQTTGHVWDETLQEYNNPLPVWWTYTFYVTIIFAIVYWVMYPSWPIGGSFLHGTKTVTYVNNKGETKTTTWNTRAQLMADMNAHAAQQKPYYDKLMSESFDQIAKDQDLSAFVASAGKTLFGDNCAACHQSGGSGKVGYFPNLTDDDWLYGGSYEKIQETITKGRHGYMPPFAEALNDDQITSLANYVLSLSGEPHDAAKAAEGNKLFHSDTAACFYCHGADAKGRQVIGSANLTDKIWLWANVPAAPDQAAKVEAVKQVIMAGVNKGVMPTWGSTEDHPQARLSPEQIKLLTVYVHDTLGGGK